MDEEDALIAFALARLDDDERFMRALMKAGERKAAIATPEDVADVLGLMAGLLSDPGAYAELERWADHDLMPPSSTERILAGIAMKRALLRLHSPKPLVTQADRDSPEEPGAPWRQCAAHDWVLWPCETARLIVAAWDAHPGYKAEWKP